MAWQPEVGSRSTCEVTKDSRICTHSVRKQKASPQRGIRYTLPLSEFHDDGGEHIWRICCKVNEEFLS